MVSSVGNNPFDPNRSQIKQELKINLKKVETFLKTPEEFRKPVDTFRGKARLPFSNLMIGFILAKVLSAFPAFISKLTAILFPKEKGSKITTS